PGRRLPEDGGRGLGRAGLATVARARPRERHGEGEAPEESPEDGRPEGVTRHPRLRRDGAVGALGLALVLAGCAAHVPPLATPSVALGDEAARALVERWAAEWQTFTGLRAAVDLTVKAPKREDRASALLLVSPSALRLEITTPLGFPALVAPAGPDGMVVSRPCERRAMAGAPTPEAVQHWLGVPVDPAALVGLLVGYVPAPDPGTLQTEGGADPHLVYAHRGVRHRVWVTAAGFPAPLLVDPQPALTAPHPPTPHPPL